MISRRAAGTSSWFGAAATNARRSASPAFASPDFTRAKPKRYCASGSQGAARADGKSMAERRAVRARGRSCKRRPLGAPPGAAEQRVRVGGGGPQRDEGAGEGTEGQMQVDGGREGLNYGNLSSYF